MIGTYERVPSADVNESHGRLFTEANYRVEPADPSAAFLAFGVRREAKVCDTDTRVRSHCTGRRLGYGRPIGEGLRDN